MKTPLCVRVPITINLDYLPNNGFQKIGLDYVFQERKYETTFALLMQPFLMLGLVAESV